MWKNYEQIILSSGDCNYLLPMIFIGDNGKQTAYYDCKDYAPLSDYCIQKSEDALFILEKILLILDNVVEYLFTPARLTLNTDTVFYNQENGEIKIAYVPLQDDATSLRRNLIKFIAQLKSELKDPGAIYLDRTARLIRHDGKSMSEIIRRVGLFKRELYQKTSVSS